MRLFTTLLLCTFLFQSCQFLSKKDADSSDNQSTAVEDDEPTDALTDIFSDMEDILTDGLEGADSDDGESPGLDDLFGGLLGGDGEGLSLDSLFGGFIEQLEQFESMSEDDLKEFVLDQSNMEEEELEILKSLPEDKNINSQSQAQEIVDSFEDIDVESLLADTTNSAAFRRALSNKTKRQYKRAQSVLKAADTEEQRFKKENPDLFFGENVGQSYLGVKSSMIYLPLGDASFADEVVDYRENDDIRYPMEWALGPPDCPDPNKADLGGVANLGIKGQLTLKFTDNALVDVNGPDLYVFEIGEIEPTLLEISENGTDWIEVGQINGGTAQVDIGDAVEEGQIFYYVRLTDLETHSALPGADIDAVAAIGSAMKLNLSSSVLFDTGKSELKEEGIYAIGELAQQMEDFTGAAIKVVGHTDDVGDESSNLKLSRDRAKSVSAALKKALDNKDMSFSESGRGESSPIAPNDSDENRQKNRRVEILVVPK